MHRGPRQAHHLLAVDLHLPLLPHVVLLSGHVPGHVFRWRTGQLWLPCLQKPLHAHLFLGFCCLLRHTVGTCSRPLRPHCPHSIHEPAARRPAACPGLSTSRWLPPAILPGQQGDPELPQAGTEPRWAAVSVHRGLVLWVRGVLQ